MYKRIKDINWYYSLKDYGKKKGLFSNYPRSSLLNKQLICWDYCGEDKTQRLYTVFKSYIDFAFFHFTLNETSRTFYEIILGENPQKPHFDLDINSENLTSEEVQSVLNSLICSIVETLKEKEINVSLKKDVCVYSSHGKDKYSFHIIINNYCHANNLEAKAFYIEVCKKLPNEYIKWIDSKVYSITQQFRCLGSQKSKSNRIKIFHETWKYKGETIKHEYIEEAANEKQLFLIQLNESLISARTSECDVLPSFRDLSKEENNYEGSENVDIDEAKEAMNLLARLGGINWESSKNPFKFDRIEGPFVVLKRVKKSRCRICRRIHDHQNPYLWITNDKSVYFDCRRAPDKKKLFLGKLYYEEEVEKEIEIKPVCNNFIINNIERAKKMASMTTEYNKKITKIFDNEEEIPQINEIQEKAKRNLKLF